MRSSVSIVLFFLLSGFFLSLLLGAIEHSRRLLAIAGACLVAVVCVIVILTPVQLPWDHDDGQGSGAGGGSTTTSQAGSVTTSTVAPPPTTAVDIPIFIPNFTVTTFNRTANTGGPYDGRY